METNYYTKKAIIDEVNKRVGIKIPYITLYTYEKKGYLKPCGMLPDGKRSVPIYDEDSLQEFIETLFTLKAEGKIRQTRE